MKITRTINGQEETISINSAAADKPCLAFWIDDSGKKWTGPPLAFMINQGFEIVPPVPEIPPTYEEEVTAKIQSFEDGLDLMIDGVARDKGYGKISMTPTASCLGYAGYVNSQQENAIAFGTWMDKVYSDALQIQANFLYGLVPEPTFEDVLSQLDIMVWPN